MDKAFAFLEAGKVTRLHTVPHLQHYDIAQHSWRMAMLLYALFPDPGPSKRLLWAVLTHDVAERWIGDTPTTIKWASPELTAALDNLEEQVNNFFGFKFKLIEKERRWLKALDLLELYLYCLDEIAMGNRHILQVRDECYKILSKHKEVPREVRTWLLSLQNWKRENNRWDKISKQDQA